MPRSSKKPDRGRWMLQRERFRLDRPTPPPPSADAAPVGDAVMEVMRRVEAAQVPLTAELEAAWPRVAGDAVARHTRPGELRGTQLVVLVDSPTWLSELRRTASTRLLAGIQRSAGSRVQSVVLRLDPRGGGPTR